MDGITTNRWDRRLKREITVCPPAVILGILIWMVLGACTGSGSVPLPPVTQNPTGQYQVGKFVWFDLLSEDIPAAKMFYSRLFGWKILSPEQYPGYFVIYNGDIAIGGMASHENRDAHQPESLWLPSLSIEDMGEALERVSENGGTVVDGPLKARGRGRIALIEDPGAAPLFLIRSADGDPVIRPAVGDWIWIDLFTQNAGPAGDFYVAVVGYQAEIVETGEEHTYHVLKRDGQMRAGIVELKWNGLEDNWLPYVKVAQIDAMVKRARSLDAKLILQTDNIAILEDPTGAAFGIQQR